MFGRKALFTRQPGRCTVFGVRDCAACFTGPDGASVKLLLGTARAITRAGRQIGANLVHIGDPHREDRLDGWAGVPTPFARRITLRTAAVVRPRANPTSSPGRAESGSDDHQWANRATRECASATQVLPIEEAERAAPLYPR